MASNKSFKNRKTAYSDVMSDYSTRLNLREEEAFDLLNQSFSKLKEGPYLGTIVQADYIKRSGRIRALIRIPEIHDYLIPPGCGAKKDEYNLFYKSMLISAISKFSSNNANIQHADVPESYENLVVEVIFPDGAPTNSGQMRGATFSLIPSPLRSKAGSTSRFCYKSGVGGRALKWNSLNSKGTSQLGPDQGVIVAVNNVTNATNATSLNAGYPPYTGPEFLKYPVKHSSFYLTSPFGYRIHPKTKDVRFHSGYDLGGMAEGTPVLAACDGKVAKVYWHDDVGNVVLLSHQEGKYLTEYMHLNHVRVKKGQDVKIGQHIGGVGKTGSSVTGVHLHYVIRVKSKSKDPMLHPALYVMPDQHAADTRAIAADKAKKAQNNTKVCGPSPKHESCK